jgi:hypothetical protein
MQALLRTPRTLLAVPVALSVALGVGALLTSPAASQEVSAPAAQVGAPAAAATCSVGSTVVDNTAGAANWAPLTRWKWTFTRTEVILTRPGTPPSGPRRPYEYAVLTKGPELTSVQVDAEVRIDRPVTVANRDVVVIFGYQSRTRFYYAHLSSANNSYAHNGIFLVNDADRVRIDDQWNGRVGAPPAITDTAYHRVRIRHCPATGSIAVYMDGATTPLMTATNTALRHGRVAFGSFDDYGRTRNFTLTGTPVIVS